MAEVKRRQRDRLQSATKRRSTATCSFRDKEMDGVALESILQNFLTNRSPRRRLGRTSPNHGSPTAGSPKNGSLSEIIFQGKLTENHRRATSLRAKDVCKNEWNSAINLTENSPQKETQSMSKENRETDVVPPTTEMKTHTKVDYKGFTHPTSRTNSSSSSGRPLSGTIEDDMEDLGDNNEEEAQKLREASKKVLHFQINRSSVSSGDYGFENQKSPGVTNASPRHRTFNEDIQRYLGETSNEDLAQFVLNTQSSSKSNINRRHTVSIPAQSPTSDEEANNLCAPTSDRTRRPVLKDIGRIASEGAGQHQEFDFNDVSVKSKKYGAQDQSSPSAEKKSKPNVPSALVLDKEHGEQNQEDTTMEAAQNHPQKKGQSINPKSPWLKTETSGFFGFLKRLGDMGKLPASKDTARRGTGSLV